MVSRQYPFPLVDVEAGEIHDIVLERANHMTFLVPIFKCGAGKHSMQREAAWGMRHAAAFKLRIRLGFGEHAT